LTYISLGNQLQEVDGIISLGTNGLFLGLFNIEEIPLLGDTKQE
jgi:hypothetical protein